MGQGRTTNERYPLTQNDSVVTAFRFTKDELAVLEQHAKSLGISKNKMARQAIRTYFGMRALSNESTTPGTDKGFTVT